MLFEINTLMWLVWYMVIAKWLMKNVCYAKRLAHAKQFYQLQTIVSSHRFWSQHNWQSLISPVHDTFRDSGPRFEPHKHARCTEPATIWSPYLPKSSGAHYNQREQRTLAPIERVRVRMNYVRTYIVYNYSVWRWSHYFGSLDDFPWATTPSLAGSNF